jgi:hypothetical protein
VNFAALPKDLFPVFAFMRHVGEGVVCTLGQLLVFNLLREQDYVLYNLKCCILLHTYLATEVYFVFPHRFKQVAADDSLNGTR